MGTWRHTERLPPPLLFLNTAVTSWIELQKQHQIIQHRQTSTSPVAVGVSTAVVWLKSQGHGPSVRMLVHTGSYRSRAKRHLNSASNFRSARKKNGVFQVVILITNRLQINSGLQAVISCNHVVPLYFLHPDEQCKQCGWL